MNETGAVKFHYESDGKKLAPFAGFEELNAARQELRRMGLMGMGLNGIGFGNLSLRDGGSFYITGSGTGGLVSLGWQDYARVVAYDFERNWLRSEGLAIPSAESLTHAAVYAMDTEAGAVLHGHAREVWRELIARGSCTSPTVLYGTPAMAHEVERLFRETNVGRRRIFAMAGHENGIIAFGRTLPAALDALGHAG